MSREHWNGYGLTEDECPEPFTYHPTIHKQPKWTQEDVYAYREALVRLGIDAMAIEHQIEKDCGREFSERPMLTVKQAGL